MTSVDCIIPRQSIKTLLDRASAVGSPIEDKDLATKKYVDEGVGTKISLTGEDINGVYPDTMSMTLVKYGDMTAFHMDYLPVFTAGGSGIIQTSVGLIPADYRPSTNQYIVCLVSGDPYYNIVGSNGSVTVAASKTFAESEENLYISNSFAVW